MTSWLESEEKPEQTREDAPREPPEEPVSLTTRRIRNWLMGTFGRREAPEEESR